MFDVEMKIDPICDESTRGFGGQAACRACPRRFGGTAPLAGVVDGTSFRAGRRPDLCPQSRKTPTSSVSKGNKLRCVLEFKFRCCVDYIGCYVLINARSERIRKDEKIGHS